VEVSGMSFGVAAIGTVDNHTCTLLAVTRAVLGRE
jgi:hypothetical protein